MYVRTSDLFRGAAVLASVAVVATVLTVVVGRAFAESGRWRFGGGSKTLLYTHPRNP
jgi:hypothetical protein